MNKVMTSACLAVIATITAAASVLPPQSMDQQSYEAPARPWENVDRAERERHCRDRIQHVRDTNGQPQIRRETARPDKPLLIAAVDKRIDGCSVMVMRHDTSDIRPLPKIEQRLEIIPAR